MPIDHDSVTIACPAHCLTVRLVLEVPKGDSLTWLICDVSAAARLWPLQFTLTLRLQTT